MFLNNLHRTPMRGLLLLSASICAFQTTPLAGQTACSGTNPPCVLTAQYGNLRQGYNNHETVLTPSKLQNSGLSQQTPLLVDYPSSTLSVGIQNAIYAQPLYVAGMHVSGNSNCGSSPNYTCNMLVAVTQAGSVWAFNADSGKVIWSDCQSHDGITCTNGALWQEDCGNAGGPGVAPFGAASTSFEGILSTPVIDTTPATPVMYLTSLCQTAASTEGAQQWWIHKLKLTDGTDATAAKQITATVSDYDGADNDNQGQVSFPAWQQAQRPALLEVTASGASPSQLIYVAFGVGMVSEDLQPYQGWIFGYDASLNQKFAFLTNAKGDAGGSNTDLPACTNGPPSTCSCTALTNGNPNPNCADIFTGGCCTVACIPTATSGTKYQWVSNYCGHAAGIWSSGKGPAASPDPFGKSHAYFVTGNGGFQQWDFNGALLNPIQNWGGAVLDLTLSSSGYDSAPSQYFVPTGPTPVQPTVSSGGNVPVCPPAAGPCNFEILSQNEFDTGVSGILLFDDFSGTNHVLTCDKAGYCYLLEQGNLCGAGGSGGCYPGTPTGLPGLKYGDPANWFPFAANVTQCADLSDDGNCDRITSLAFSNDSSPERLYLWPNNERMTALELSDYSTQTGTGTIAVSGKAVTGTGTSFLSEVIPGDKLVVGSCILPNACPTITAVADNSHLTISQSVSVSGVSFQYAGFFVRPIYDSRPLDGVVGFPGGSVVVTSNAGSNVVVWGLANVGTSSISTLYAYDATMNFLWCANSGGNCNASVSYHNTKFALPTVVNGYVYVPTSGLTYSAGSSMCPSSGTSCSGILVWH